MGVFSEYVTQYKLHWSVDNLDWHLLQPSDNSDVWDGNVDGVSHVRNTLVLPVVARYFKLTIVDFVDQPSLNWGVFGCDTDRGWY